MGSLVIVKVGRTLRLERHVVKYGGHARKMVDWKWAVRIKRWKVKDRWSIEERILE